MEISSSIDYIIKSAKYDENALQKIKNYTKSMNRLIQELLTLTKLENLNIINSQKEVNVSPILSQCIFDIAVRASEKNLDLQVSIPNELYIKVIPEHFQLVISNLLDNSIKYTPS
jgi:signal transduction histidine kinase